MNSTIELLQLDTQGRVRTLRERREMLHGTRCRALHDSSRIAGKLPPDPDLRAEDLMKENLKWA